MAREFTQSTHGRLGCTYCHGGNAGSVDVKTAHQNLVARPSEQADQYCAKCHTDTVSKYKTSLHYTLKGLENGLRKLSGEKMWPQTQKIFQGSCYSCHATCGTCHVSKPAAVRGGLIAGHQFARTPPMEQTCNGCHGGRVGPEYLGQNEGFPADVHWQKAGMTCLDCHDRKAFHGDGRQYANRFEVPSKPSCLSCHPAAAPGNSPVAAHNVHGQKLDCYVCHATAYKSCYDCHAGAGAQSRLDFKIGLNTRPDLPYQYTLLRHMPTVRDMIDAKIPGGLADFDAVSNWKTAAVHNIQRITPRNKTCNGCHGNSRIFLLPSVLAPTDSAASQKVVVPEVPPKK